MGRNIDLNEMVNEEEMICCKCGCNNSNVLEEFDIDCYEFINGICDYEFECSNCTFNHNIKIKITVLTGNSNPSESGERINNEGITESTGKSK